MSLRILFIDPMGTDLYSKHMLRVLRPQANSDTKVVSRCLKGVPKTPFLPPVQAFTNQLFQAVIDAEKDGFDGVVINCAADPGLKDAKMLVDIPVTAPFEAAARTAPSLGRLCVVVPTIDFSEGENPPISAKAMNSNWARDLIREYGITELVTSVRAASIKHPSIEKCMKLFKTNPKKVRQLVLSSMKQAIKSTAMAHSKKAVNEDEATVLFFACTLWAGMLGPIAKSVPAIVLDPVVTPLKYIEMLAANRKCY